MRTRIKWETSVKQTNPTVDRLTKHHHTERGLGRDCLLANCTVSGLVSYFFIAPLFIFQLKATVASVPRWAMKLVSGDVSNQAPRGHVAICIAPMCFTIRLDCVINHDAFCPHSVHKLCHFWDCHIFAIQAFSIFFYTYSFNYASTDTVKSHPVQVTKCAQ